MSNYNDSAGVRKGRVATVVAIASAIAIPAEGLRQWAYDDIANPALLTVCYGHTGPDVVKNREYSLNECKALLSKDMLDAVETVERCHPGLPLPIHAAFADAVFNLGPTIVCSSSGSTAARMLYAHDYAGACNQLPRWSKAKVMGVMVELPGLTTRRAKEQALCLTGVA